MTCREMDLLLVDLVERGLPPARLRWAERHLSGCPACAVDAALYRQVIQCARRLPTAELPKAVAQRLRALASLRAGQRPAEASPRSAP